MYHAIVKRVLRKGFARLSRGDHKGITELLTPDCHYRFVGDHALGGERTSRDGIERWFECFSRVLPGFRVVPEQIVVEGWPWNTTAALRLNFSYDRPDGQPMSMSRSRWRACAGARPMRF